MPWRASECKRLVVSGMVCVSANSCNNQGPVIVGGMPSGKGFEGTKNGIQQSGGFLATCLHAWRAGATAGESSPNSLGQLAGQVPLSFTV